MKEREDGQTEGRGMMYSIQLNKKLSYRREAARASYCCVLWLVAKGCSK